MYWCKRSILVLIFNRVFEYDGSFLLFKHRPKWSPSKIHMACHGKAAGIFIAVRSRYRVDSRGMARRGGCTRMGL